MKQNIDEIIQYIARREGISEQEVIHEMQIAIDAGYDNPDPDVQAQWAAMPFAGKPTPQEFILYLTAKASKQN